MPAQALGMDWYAIRIQSRLAALAEATLQGKGYEVFQPRYLARRQWSDRVKTVALPLFPGYLFSRFNASGRLLPILTTPGVIHIVGAGRTPLPVGEEELRAIRSVVESGLPALPWPYLQAGARVLILRGPLRGLAGIVTGDTRRCRLVLTVPLLQRSVAVEIDRDWIHPID